MFCNDPSISRSPQMPTSSHPNASSSETRFCLISGAFLGRYVTSPANCVMADRFFRCYGGISVGGCVKSDGFSGMGVTEFSEASRKDNRSLGGFLIGLGGPLGGSVSDLLDASLHNPFCVYKSWQSGQVKLSSTLRKSADLKHPLGETHHRY